MDLACSTACFSREPLDVALRKISMLEFSKAELVVGLDHPHLTLDMFDDDASQVDERLRQGPTLGICGLNVQVPASHPGLDDAIDRLAHWASQHSVPLVAIEAKAVGTSVDEEIKRLKKLVQSATAHGTLLCLLTKLGTLTEDPSVANKLCQQVEGLQLALDPSYYMAGRSDELNFDPLFAHVRHVLLRDTGPEKSQYQMKVGQGNTDFSRIMSSLARYNYAGSLVIQYFDNPDPGYDVGREVRKLGLLLESQL